MTRAAIYARFSSDLQDARSIGDQVALCCDYAQKRGYAVARVYDDAAASGASMHGRPGIARMLADAALNSFDVLLTESMSRIGRDEEDRAGLRKRLKFYAITIETPSDGVVHPMLDGVKAVIDAAYLEDLKRATRRGQGARVKEGLSGGGLTYGYRPGESKGARVIEPDEAEVVRRIFTAYAAGTSPRAIAARLNMDGIKPPRGDVWLASAINGNPLRGSGILSNALYDGRLVWNRVTMRKDPRTGKRVSRANPPEDWITTPVEALRIVPPDLFTLAASQKAARGHQRPERSHRPRHLLSGLLRCGCCGSAMVVNNPRHAGRRIYCGRRKEGGACPHGHTYALAPIEARVVAALQAQLADPSAIERYLATYRAERKRLAAEASGQRTRLEHGLAQTERAIARIVDAIADGTMTSADARQRLPELRSRKATIETDLAALAPPTKVVALHPAAVTSYLACVEDLADTLRRRQVEGDEAPAAALRELVAAVVIHPRDREPAIEVTGRLASLMGGGADVFPQQMIAGSQTLVAGARYRRQKWAINGDLRYQFPA